MQRTYVAASTTRTERRSFNIHRRHRCWSSLEEHLGRSPVENANCRHRCRSLQQLAMLRYVDVAQAKLTTLTTTLLTTALLTVAAAT